MSSSSSISERKNAFKKGIDRDDARKKREEKGFELRKSKREEGLQKRRALHTAATDANDSVQEAATTNTAHPKDIMALVSGAYVESTALECVIGLRKLLSIEKQPPIDEVIGSGVVPHLVQLLAIDAVPKLQFEAAWCLTNIASGTSAQTRTIAEANAIPAFVRLLSSPADDTREQAIWALGNIAGDGPQLRDAVLAAGALTSLLNTVTSSPTVSMLRTAVWVISNLCRGKPVPNLDSVREAIPTLAEIVRSSSDEEVLSDALWALSYLTDGDDARIGVVLETGIAVRLVTCLTNVSSKIKLPALRTIGNIVTGADQLTQQVVDAGALPLLGQLITAGTKMQERKEACWAISNIAAGTPAQLNAVLQSGVLLPVAHALKNAEFEVKKEACWTVCNSVHGSSSEQVMFIANSYGVLEPMCELLETSDSKVVTITLDFLTNVLKAADEVSAASGAENKVVMSLDELGAIDKLEALQEHSHHEVYEKAVHILEKYFGEEDAEDSAAAPTTCAGGQQFAFGMQPAAGGCEQPLPTFMFAA